MLALLLTPIFAAADRIVGGAGRRSLGMALALLGGGVVGYFAGGWPLVLMAAAWCGYRSLPWKVGGSTTPRGAGQIVAAFARHALPALVAGAAHVGGWFGVDLLPLTLCLLAYAVAATLLAVAYAKRVDRLAAAGEAEDGQVNDTIEIIRGAAFGAALAASVLL